VRLSLNVTTRKNNFFQREGENETRSVRHSRAARGESIAMATLWRAWRVMARRHGRPFADGLTPPSAAATKAAAEARDAAGKTAAVRTNVTRRGYPTGTRVLGHHRGPPTMAYVVELHVTPDIVSAPPGGACDVLVEGGEVGTDVGHVSVTSWKNAGYDFLVTVAPPPASDPGRRADLVRAYKSALDAAWGIGVTHHARAGNERAREPARRDDPEPENAYETENARLLLGNPTSSPPGNGRPATAKAVDADRAEDDDRARLFGAVVALPLLGLGVHPTPASTQLAARAAAEAVCDYVPPVHLRDRNRETEWALGELAPALGPPPFAARFAVPDEAAATILERELETHLCQGYLAAQIVSRQFL
jgi:hypothetical protein